MAIKSLIINPGSTSTKIGVFEDENLLFEETLRHSTEEISKYDTIFEQKDFRKKIITDLLAEKNCDLKSFNVIVGRGGLLKPIHSGTYAVTDDLLEDLKAAYFYENESGHAAASYTGIAFRALDTENLSDKDIEYIKESVQNLVILEDKENNDMEPLSNLFILASQAQSESLKIHALTEKLS